MLPESKMANHAIIPSLAWCVCVSVPTEADDNITGSYNIHGLRSDSIVDEYFQCPVQEVFVENRRNGFLNAIVKAANIEHWK